VRYALWGEWMMGFSLVKEIINCILGNIAINFIIGLLTGGITVQADDSVVIAPTLREYIWITALILGLIVGYLVTHAVVKAVGESIVENRDAVNGTDAYQGSSWVWLRKLPRKKWALTGLVMFLSVAVALPVLPWTMDVLGVARMNFYQFCLLISVYSIISSKLLGKLIIARCAQPDYVEWKLKCLDT
jgi:uncharacterized membrane protein